ncbi:hypothetical protein [Roseovarius pelagicus]|uniref:Uncharacterized protein n=1 Tax=Roseovarius pelagicus TaxID=2980108 RepID=A0ABY6D6T7_9RHOB|nr:hypothetical protein [Roseovarius pelagicus]UXX81850.1 hypothetical protein N7U68_12015 [Roseovarius pelagicus]
MVESQLRMAHVLATAAITSNPFAAPANLRKQIVRPVETSASTPKAKADAPLREISKPQPAATNADVRTAPKAGTQQPESKSKTAAPASRSRAPSKPPAMPARASKAIGSGTDPVKHTDGQIT